MTKRWFNSLLLKGWFHGCELFTLITTTTPLVLGLPGQRLSFRRGGEKLIKRDIEDVAAGLTLCKKIKDNIQTSHVPVILLTAKAEIDNRIEGLQVGADSYIPKPFHPEHLFIRIEKLIQRMEQIRQSFRISLSLS